MKKLLLLALLAPTAAFAQANPATVKAPTLPGHVTNKAYVDQGLASKAPIAPNNGSYYLQRNGGWTPFGGPLNDVPNDGQVYGRSGTGWAVYTGGGSASVTSSSITTALGYTPQPTLGFAPVNKAGDTITGNLNLPSFTIANNLAQNSANCSSLAGAQATDGTASWEPTCFGTWATQGQSISVAPTRGVNMIGGAPDPSLKTPFLVQTQSNGASAINQNGVSINMDIVGGAESNARLDTTNTVGTMITARQRPGPGGTRPPSFWGINTDIHIAPNSGNTITYAWENDLNNFNQDCYAGSPCQVFGMFLNGVGAYPGTAWIYGGGGDTTAFNGTVTTSGNTITRVSGNAFTRSITRMTVNGTVYRVGFVDASHMTLITGTVPTYSSAVTYSAKSAFMHDGILFGGDDHISDNDIHLNTGAYNAITAGGKHHVVLNTNDDSAPYAASFKQSQKACFNAFANCLYSDPSWGLRTDGNVFVNGGATINSLSVVGAITTGSLTTSGSVTAAGFSTTGGISTGSLTSTSTVAAGGFATGGSVTANSVVAPLHQSTSITTSQLPGCNTTTRGTSATITDALSAPTAANYMTGINGGGSNFASILCTGSAWVYH